MNITQEQLEQAILGVTGGPDWDMVKQGLLNEIYQIQSNMLDAPSWDSVNELRGFAKGLMFVIGLREQTINAIESREESRRFLEGLRAENDATV